MWHPLDTSEYPGEHSFFCCAQNDDVSSRILSIIETVHEEGSRTIDDILRKLLTSFSRTLINGVNYVQQSDESDEGEEEEEDILIFDEYDNGDDDDIAVGIIQSDIRTSLLLRYVPNDLV